MVCGGMGYGGYSPDGGNGACIGMADLGVPFPEDWSPEIEELFGTKAWVSRYEGRLDGPRMTTDILLSPEGDRRYANNIWENSTGSCHTCPNYEPYDPIDAGTDAGEDPQCADAGFDPSTGEHLQCPNGGCASAGGGAVALPLALLPLLCLSRRRKIR